jgi:hypothetical protein
MADLRERGSSPRCDLSRPDTPGGIAFTRGPLAHFLRNRFYIGEVAFKGEVSREQPAILDRSFDAVQARLTITATTTRSHAANPIPADRSHL